MLHVDSLHAGYDNLRVLHGIDLDVPAGHLLAVIGANGAGKTTVLRAVSGLLRPSSGTVTVDGRAVTGLRAEKVAAAGLAHVPENRLVFPSLTVADNLALGGWTRRRLPRRQISFSLPRRQISFSLPRRQISFSRSLRGTDDRDRILDLFPRLRSRLAQPAGTLSGGEQQMVVIGRGLMAGPKVLVLDEPSVGLAPRLVAEIFAALARLRDEAGLAILLVEQNARAAFRVADRVAVMDRGRIVTSGTPAELEGDDRVQRAYLGGGYSESSTVD